MLVGLIAASCAAPYTSTASHPPPSTSTVVPATTTTTTTTTTPLTTTTTTVTTFEPMGSSFISAQEGWVLGASGCQSCAGLDVTDDGGAIWRPLPAPPVPLGLYSQAANAVTDVYFADQNEGFLFGPGLETTHDGGQTWSRAELPAVTQLTGSDGYVFALSENASDTGASLWRTTAGSNTWSPLAMPQTSGGFELAAQGSTLLLLQGGFSGPHPQSAAIEVGALWISTDGGTEWVSRKVPCTSADGGAALVSIALGHPDAWLVDCYDNEQSSQEQQTQHHLYGTGNAGGDWVRLADPTQTGAPALLADNGSGHAFLATEGGLADWLVGTFDGGLSWSGLFTSGGSFYGWADLQFVDASTGFIVGPTHYAPEHLYRTEDGGHTWAVVPITLPS